MNVFAIYVLALPIIAFAINELWEEFSFEFYKGFGEFRYKQASKKSRGIVELEFPMIVELFAILLSASVSPATALSRISERASGEFAGVLRDAVKDIQHGANFGQALDMLSERVASPIVRRFCDSLMIAVERGSPLLEVVGRQVEEVRQAQRTSMLEASSKAEIGLMIPVVFLILPISVLFALWPSYFSLGRAVGL